MTFIKYLVETSPKNTYMEYIGIIIQTIYAEQIRAENQMEPTQIIPKYIRNNIILRSQWKYTENCSQNKTEQPYETLERLHIRVYEISKHGKHANGVFMETGNPIYDVILNSLHNNSSTKEKIPYHNLPRKTEPSSRTLD
jgi:hypothetical protein